MAVVLSESSDLTDITAAIRRTPMDLADLRGLIAAVAAKVGTVRGFDMELVIEALDTAHDEVEKAPAYGYEQRGADEAHHFGEMCDADARGGL